MAETRAPALSEGLRMIELVAAAGEPVSFEELLGQVRMSRSSVDRILKVLVSADYLSRGPGTRSGYRPGLRLLGICRRAVDACPVGQSIQEHLDAAAAKLGKSVQLALWEPLLGRIVVVAKAEPTDSLVVAGPGQDISSYAHRHATGKLVLAAADEQQRRKLFERMTPQQCTAHTTMPGPALDSALRQVCKDGYAVDREEHAAGIYRVAVAVRNDAGGLRGGLCAIWHALEYRQEVVEQCRGVLSVTAERLAQLVRYPELSNPLKEER